MTKTGTDIYVKYNATNATMQIYDYATWFISSELSCTPTFFLSSTNVAPTSDTIAGANMNSTATTLTVDLPAMWADPNIQGGVNHTFYLISWFPSSGNFAALRLDFEKLSACWSDSNDQILMNTTSHAESFGISAPIKTFDYASWFSTNNVNCLLSNLSFYFTTNIAEPIQETITGVTFLPSTTNFTVDLPNWYADTTFLDNTERVFYLVAESAIPSLHRQVFKLSFKKTLYKCWQSSADSILLNTPSNATSFNNDTLK